MRNSVNCIHPYAKNPITIFYLFFFLIDYINSMRIFQKLPFESHYIGDFKYISFFFRFFKHLYRFFEHQRFFNN